MSLFFKNTAPAAARMWGGNGQKQKPRCVFSYGLQTSFMLHGRAGKELLQTGCQVKNSGISERIKYTQFGHNSSFI